MKNQAGRLIAIMHPHDDNRESGKIVWGVNPAANSVKPPDIERLYSGSACAGGGGVADDSGREQIAQLAIQLRAAPDFRDSAVGGTTWAAHIHRLTFRFIPTVEVKPFVKSFDPAPPIAPP